ncbi:non-self recognition 1_L protein [Cryphonectria parasitica EP155]|uniref:Non-self recognition 1_L protein n=1 Tax=Cryphonectria parasitica (strain ATCC 38755 / EP155) TaxID=660469 RepID=A0A9P4YDH0_CRYP1|nr:non-self recognition 1_L protein [Cryphonectria parasitica EP155]KAF3770862.1 non-self recognition 1_L protein [Cryphonectria parasitica EP155]
MAELKEPASQHNLWYGSPVQMSTSRPSHAADAGLSSTGSNSPQSGRPRQGGWGSVDHHSQYSSYSRYSQDDSAADPYERHAQQHSLTSHQSFPSLKRPYSATEQPPYQEIVQDLRDDGTKLGVGHDHKLLSFRKVPDKLTILDGHGRIQQLELTAQLHGMFFLSEMPTTNNDGSVSGSLITPRGPMSVITETGETVPVSATEVTISAIESVDGHPVRLIVIPWKTPPPNSPEVNQAPDQEPSSLPLIPFQDDGSESEGDATANNGRRKELQQHFVVHLKVMATLANGAKAVLSEAQTAPIVVRGRSPRNFQARKEIPLLGSSAGSRGQALVETGLGIVAGPLSVKTQDSKGRPMNIELPRTAFTFTAPTKMPASPMASMRSNSYPTSWNPNMAPASGPSTYPATTIASDPYQKLPLSGTPGYATEAQELPSHLPTSMPSMQLSMVSSDQPGQHATAGASSQAPPIRTQYASYVQTSTAPAPLSATATATSGLSVPRYVDDANPRPSKSPRHPSHPSIHAASISSTESSNEYRYGPPAYGSISSTSAEISPGTSQHHSYSTSAAAPDSGAAPSSNTAAQPPRDYYPPSASWTTTAGESSAPTYANGEHRPSYSYSTEQYKTSAGVKNDPHAPAAPVYPGQAVGHYSWNTS